MNHRSAAKSHFRSRMLERYGRAPSIKETDNIRLAIKTRQCFWSQDCGDTIRGIVHFGNIHVAVVYSKTLDGMLTAGCPLTGNRR